MPTPTEPVSLPLLFKLLEHATSLSIVSDFLKSKRLPFSAGSWRDMVSKRLEPALNESQISVNELIDLLRTVEEYGRQHVFLFRASARKAHEIMERTAVASALRTMQLSDLLEHPKLYDMPKDPVISDVRWTSARTDVELIVKEIQCRETFELEDVTTTESSMTKLYKRTVERGVNIARLHRHGLLELRIASRAGPSRYGPDVMQFRRRIASIIPMDGFAEVSLRNAKNKLWLSRESLQGKIRYSEIAARNDEDFVLKASGGHQEANVTSNAASVTSMQNFIGMQGRCESFNLWFSKDHTPSQRDIHFFVSGEVNEFAITANCTKDDYEYVLDQLRELNS